jgi:Skp family chaperone for outer membrane proteins
MYESICAELYKVVKKYDYLLNEGGVSIADKVLYDKTVDVLIGAKPIAI